MAESVKEPPTGAASGLRGVVVGSSTVSDVVGDKGQLIYQGYDIHDLATHSTFEEVAFLLWNKRLPTRSELQELRVQISSSYNVPGEVIDLLRRMPVDADPTDVLRTAISALEFYDPNARDISIQASRRTAIKLTAQFPTVVAAVDRLRRGHEPVSPLPHENIATNFLYMLKGEKPSEYEAKLFDVCLILHADHELNASTFTARVVAGTLATVYASVVGAIAALSGPLHGGANTAVMKTLLEIGEPDRVESYLKSALAAKKKIMGFGHAVYKTEDPRATHLRQFSREAGERGGNTKWYEMSRKLEELMLREKGLYPNVDFYSASTYYMMGIPLDLYTPIFAVSRITGWTAHILEQYSDNKLIRPRADYVGPRDLKYVPIDERNA